MVTVAVEFGDSIYFFWSIVLLQHGHLRKMSRNNMNCYGFEKNIPFAIMDCLYFWVGTVTLV